MGTQRLQQLFQDKKSDLLSIYITAGYPEKDAMPKLIKVLSDKGVDFIEAGMPYSDPLADGPTIQHSSSVALKNGMNLSLYFKQIAQVRQEVDLPILFMGYFNQILKTGIEKFLQQCETAGIDGLIIPDLSPEIYQNRYQDIFKKYDLGLVFLISPTTSDERIQLIDELSSAFIYVVSSSATTGKTGNFGKEHLQYFEKIKQMSLQNPTMIGFGIDSANKFQTACRYANGAIIGSALIKALSHENYLISVERFLENIR